ncbi:PocR ligand-binding domain-containing protein [Abyssisolibacter fermentans]|uniref:PocR ligand-binding domain-containing protein n=1 Tax=Abyssisolibacter fermentans TaxID=1766203 RepID=UPI000829F3E8|nr:PocR ligand-binding domain-containing protein [Abyssisolibacter fermentans]
MDTKDKKDFSILRPFNQNFSWGCIKWLKEPEDFDNKKMIVGHVTFLPHKKQGRHLHSGSEQILYVISGVGEHWVGDKYYPLLPGSIHHIQHNVGHELKNTGDNPLEMIIVYNPRSVELENMPAENDLLDNFNYSNIVKMIDFDTIQKIQDELSKALDLSIVIEDKEGKFLTKPSNISGFCKQMYDNNENRCLKEHIIVFNTTEVQVKTCCYNLVKISAPIYINNEHFGNIMCGPVILNGQSDEVVKQIKALEDSNKVEMLTKAYKDTTVITKARLYAIIESLKTINKFIVEAGLNNLIHEEFQEKTMEILKQSQAKVELEKALKKSQIKVIESQISPHFLFNTLSVIGELAYMNGAEEAAQTTFALSNLLRTSLSKSKELITIVEEIKYLKDYIFIQNKRFKESIKVSIDIDEKIINESIPFMTLQTLIENSIKHGFKQLKREWEISITGKFIDDKMYFKVNDNGIGMNQNELSNIFEDKKESKKESTGLGLKNLNTRFKYYYGDDYRFNIKSEYKKGTEIELMLPLIDNEVYCV